jgi:hypothetical protein
MVSNMTIDPNSEETSPETPSDPPPPPITASDLDFRRMVARAQRKVKDRSTLTNQESAALKKFDRDRERALRWQYYPTIPQKDWRQMSGRPAQVINEQAERYGIPFGGPIVDLPKVVKALHDFLAANAYKLAKDDDPLMGGGDSPALEEYRKEQTLMARMKRREMERQLIPRDESRIALGKIASIIRNCGEILQRQFGPAALDVLNEALGDMDLEIERTFGGEDRTEIEPSKPDKLAGKPDNLEPPTAGEPAK